MKRPYQSPHNECLANDVVAPRMSEANAPSPSPHDGERCLDDNQAVLMADRSSLKPFDQLQP